MSKLFKVFLGLCLVFISGLVFADPTFPTITSTAVDNHTDLSISFLAQVFGNVGDVLHGTSGQMLGQLFYKFNIGILVVAGLWLGYTALTIAMKSSMDGSFMGHNKNVPVTFLKIALGVGLLLPNATTGYSIFQDVVMHVVVKGVALADDTWSYGLDYLTNGGTLWHRPEEGTQNTFKAFINRSQNQDANDFLEKSKKIFESEVCMLQSSQVKQSAPSKNSNSNYIFNADPAPISYGVVERNDSFQFPGVGNTQNLTIDGENGHCGSVTWYGIAKRAGINCAANSSDASCQMAKNAMREMVFNLLPAAKRFVCQGSSSAACIGSSSADVMADNQETFFGMIVDYINDVMPIAQKARDNVANNAKNFIPRAEQDGWMMAGRYYWDLSRIQANYAQVSSVEKFQHDFGDQKISQPSIKGWVQADQSAYQNPEVQAVVNSANGIDDAYVGGALRKMQSYSQSSSGGDTGGAYNISRGDMNGIGMNWAMAMILGPIVADIGQLISLFDTGGGSTVGVGMGTDPILFLHNVGMLCMNIAGDIWFSVGGFLFLGLILTAVCTGAFNGQTAVLGVAEWLKPPLMLLGTMLLGVGMMLGYYLPLYPFMIFIFGVIGWIIAVIEAMVAAPLVCLGLTHPEGHDFLGSAQQTLMLLLGIFIRPVLMVVGLISGMILSYVSLRILVYAYSGFLSDIFYVNTPSAGAANGDILGGAVTAMGNLMAGTGATGLVMSLIAFPLFLVVFAAMVYTVTVTCYSLIFLIPDSVGRWIGAPQPLQNMSQQMAQQVQGAASGFGSGMGRISESIRKPPSDDNNTSHNNQPDAAPAPSGGKPASAPTPAP